MEKADILEMTVAYMRAIHRRRRPGLDAVPIGRVDRYAAGFRECADHVGRYLADAGVGFGAVHDRLMSHLDKSLQSVVDADVVCHRLLPPDAGFDATAAEKLLWTAGGDCDTTAADRCPADTDDEDCECLFATGSDVRNVIRRQYAAECETTTATAGDSIDSTSTTTTRTYSQPLHPVDDSNSPKTADEFPSFPPSTAVTAADDYTSSLSSDVDDVDNDRVATCDVERDVRIMSLVSGGDLPITIRDRMTDNSSDVWQPWR